MTHFTTEQEMQKRITGLQEVYIDVLKSIGKPILLRDFCEIVKIEDSGRFLESKGLFIKVDIVPIEGVVEGHHVKAMPVVYLRNSIRINGRCFRSIPEAAVLLNRTIRWVWEEVKDG